MAWNEAKYAFEYTNSFKNPKFDSVVDDAYYDADSQELLVILNSGLGYLYNSVPSTVYSNLKYATSKGRFYSNVIKPNHGPGKNLGYDPDVEEKSYDAPVMSDVAKAGKVTFATDNSNVTFMGGSLTSPVRVSGSGSVTPADVLSDLTSLSVEAPVVRDSFKHVVHFTVEGGNDIKTYTVDAGSDVWESFNALEEALSALGINYDVKGVFVSFE